MSTTIVLRGGHLCMDLPGRFKLIRPGFLKLDCYPSCWTHRQRCFGIKLVDLRLASTWKKIVQGTGCRIRVCYSHTALKFRSKATTAIKWSSAKECLLSLTKGSCKSLGLNSVSVFLSWRRLSRLKKWGWRKEKEQETANWYQLAKSSNSLDSSTTPVST
jgi:hypothetical protein